MSSERKIVEYVAMKSPFFNDLVETVNRYIQDGWQPIGGLSHDAGKDHFMQAMVKYE